MNTRRQAARAETPRTARPSPPAHTSPMRARQRRKEVLLERAHRRPQHRADEQRRRKHAARRAARKRQRRRDDLEQRQQQQHLERKLPVHRLVDRAIPRAHHLRQSRSTRCRPPAARPPPAASAWNHSGCRAQQRTQRSPAPAQTPGMPTRPRCPAPHTPSTRADRADRPTECETSAARPRTTAPPPPPTPPTARSTPAPPARPLPDHFLNHEQDRRDGRIERRRQPRRRTHRRKDPQPLARKPHLAADQRGHARADLQRRVFRPERVAAADRQRRTAGTCPPPSGSRCSRCGYTAPPWSGSRRCRAPAGNTYRVSSAITMPAHAPAPQSAAA